MISGCASALELGLAAAAGPGGATARPASGGRTTKGLVPSPCDETLDHSPMCKITGLCQPALTQGPGMEDGHGLPSPSSQRPSARIVMGANETEGATSR